MTHRNVAVRRKTTGCDGMHVLSRALQRARSMFQDELVVRSSSGFELTLRGHKILQELEQLLPKIEGLVVQKRLRSEKEAEQFPHFWPGQSLHGIATALMPPPGDM